MSPEATTFSFLTSGPEVSVQMGALGTIPELASPIVSGVGARTWVFTPDPEASTLLSSMQGAGELVRSEEDSDGHPVEVIRRDDSPLVWWVVWRVISGIITTHLREVDGLDRVDTMLSSATVLDSQSAPFVLLRKPLFTVTSDRPGMQESALYVRDDDSTHWVQFIRPSFLPMGKFVKADSTSGYGFLRAGLEGAIEVQLSSARPSSDSIDSFMSIVDSVVVG